jgi:hypothetical protein
VLHLGAGWRFESPYPLAHYVEDRLLPLKQTFLHLLDRRLSSTQTTHDPHGRRSCYEAETKLDRRELLRDQASLGGSRAGVWSMRLRPEPGKDQ